MSYLEAFINSLPDDDIEYLSKVVFNEDGSIIDKKDLDTLIEAEELLKSQKDAVQFALKINLKKGRMV